MSAPPFSRVVWGGGQGVASVYPTKDVPWQKVHHLPDESSDDPRAPAINGGRVANNDVEKRLWEAADQLRANSKLKASEYSMPVLGLIFLRYADSRFTAMQRLLQAERAKGDGSEP